MRRSTFKILFYLKRNAQKKNGLVPVMCRITINGEISQFSCKLNVQEKLWDTNLGRLSGRSVVAQEANAILDKIRIGLTRVYYETIEKGRCVTAEKVKNLFFGLEESRKTLLSVFKQNNENYSKQVGKIKSQRSYWKYCTVYNHLKEFIKYSYNEDDLLLHEVTPVFITNFELFLRMQKGHKTNTVWSYMMPFRRVINIAVDNGWLQNNPFNNYHLSKENTKRGYLTKDEITMLINGEFKKKSYELIRDLFIFCCFSGLSWRDMYNLTTDNLKISFDGHLWITAYRQKTGTETDIRLLETAKHIIEKYQGVAEGNKLLPVPCYANCRHGLKVIAKLCGIKKNICWHQSRHSYATTICLSNGVPIETLSKLMGHTSIRTTQIYAKIIAQKVSDDIENLSKKIEQMESFICNAI
ncbi:MAG: site-specific integrase [Muribaculaceae bacterium]|nr:site-specific integrase [Muribaculaceae bacterium]